VSAPADPGAAGSLRILHVDSGREWRGGQNQVRLLARELAHDPRVAQRLVTRRASELARRASGHGVPVRQVPWGWSLDPRTLWRLTRELRAFRPTIVHAHDSHALQLAHWARLLEQRRNTWPALIGTRRVDFPVRRSSVWFRAERIVAVSNAVRDVLTADGVPPPRIAVVRDGVDPTEIREAATQPFDVRTRLGVGPKTPVIANVAALVDHKDHATLLRAAELARQTRPDVHWVIAGDGPLRPVLSAAIARGALGDRVHLLGWVPQVDALIREADVFVMCSKTEGLGSVVLHALVLGTPVVATRAGGLPEIAPPEGLVPVGDPGALARAALLALERGVGGTLPAECTAEGMARLTLAVYDAVAPGRV